MIRLYTDGACSHNPGPGGWAFAVVEKDSITYQESGHDASTTNNKMELYAMLKGLSYLQPKIKENEPIVICTDSAYCMDALTKWCHGWKKKGWRKSDNKPIENKELIVSLYSLVHTSGLSVSFEKVKAHQPKNSKYYDAYNDVVDQLATKASKSIQ